MINAETMKVLKEVVSLLSGDLSYDNRAKARDIVHELIDEKQDKDIFAALIQAVKDREALQVVPRPSDLSAECLKTRAREQAGFFQSR